MSEEKENVLRRVWKRLRGGYHDIRGTIPYVIIGYWNGLCPCCNSHIGIDVKENTLNLSKTAKCAVCNKEIYEKIIKIKSL